MGVTARNLKKSKEKDPTVYGYAGKIARLNLTTKTYSVIPTAKYLPDYVGGRCMANKIFYDEAKPGVKALDPEAMLVYMTGPTCGTGVPTGGRSLFTGISPNNWPEQYCWSGLGGYFSVELKWAGWDGLIIEGASQDPVYIYIEDDKIEFRSAANLWGKYVRETQYALEDIHGKDVKSMVIGPAGENLVRIASIVTAQDSAAAKGGFGAVWGSKKLKAITCVGHGHVEVAPGSVDKILALREKMANGKETKSLRPVVKSYDFFGDNANNRCEIPEGYGMATVACSWGCNQRCDNCYFGTVGAFGDEKINRIEKCVGRYAHALTDDMFWLPVFSYMTENNHFTSSQMMAGEMPGPNLADGPELALGKLYNLHPGDTVNHWKPNWHKGEVMMDLCAQYGLDKWDIIVWMFPWFAMCKKEGLLDDIDFGMEVDLDSEEFIRYILDIMVYRKTYYGDLLAEGMARFVRKMGKGKYGDTLYHGRISNVLGGQKLPLHVSQESVWGHSYHWAGRGFQGANDIQAWFPIGLQNMLLTRDSQTNNHFKHTWEWHEAVGNTPDKICRSPLIAEGLRRNIQAGETKDTIMCCDFQSPNFFYPTQDADMLSAATGDEWTQEEVDRLGDRSYLLMRAILMKHSGRCRDQEVRAIYPNWMQIPDASGMTVSWEQLNTAVDLLYDNFGFDRATGWPLRETYEAAGIGYVADDMDALGLLPRPSAMEQFKREGIVPQDEAYNENPVY